MDKAATRDELDAIVGSPSTPIKDERYGVNFVQHERSIRGGLHGVWDSEKGDYIATGPKHPMNQIAALGYNNNGPYINIQGYGHMRTIVPQERCPKPMTFDQLFSSPKRHEIEMKS